MIWTTLAFADPPAGVAPDDLSRWEAAAATALSGPPGCWLLGGKIEVKVVGLPAASRTARGDADTDRYTGTFEGILVDGTWQNLTFALWSAEDPTKPASIDVPLLPTIGQFAGAVMHRTNPGANTLEVHIGQEARSLIGGVVQGMSSGGTAYAQWDEKRGAIELFQDVTLKDGPKLDPVQVHTVFPGGGGASEVDLRFPRRMREGSFPFVVTFYDAQAHLRTAVVDGATLPASGSVSMGVGFLGMTLGFDQTLTWERAARCGP